MVQCMVHCMVQPSALHRERPLSAMVASPQLVSSRQWETDPTVLERKDNVEHDHVTKPCDATTPAYEEASAGGFEHCA